MTAAGDGTFSGELTLPPGTWDVTIAPATGEGTPVTRRVTRSAAAGLHGTIRITGAPSYLEIDEDGVAMAGVSGGISAAGETVSLSAQSSLRIRAGNAGAVHVAINGLDLGAMGGSGDVVMWNIAPAIP
jgi:hypothetical protein